ncbi:hypothetical protein GKD24_08405, partial [Lactobacillus paracasei]|nr:hypothetical protein [Lacticaseibacillus paracasei]MSC31082.1 hypothetical protein [Lacticaseibacillus paracasei]MSC37437.1 hypothetical protein [Lacticaseibacillus paracasei]MSC43777.1 hypothetical protein [Lacticaseibacillus paracasei]
MHTFSCCLCTGNWQECQWSGQKLSGSAECVWLSLKFTHYQIFYQRLILF